MKNYLPWIGYRKFDKEAHSEYLARGIERAGHQLIKTDDMTSGIDILQKKVYSHIILNDVLPDLPNAGFTMDSLAAIKNLRGYESTRIIVPHLLVEEDENILRGENVYLVDVYDPRRALEEILGILAEPARTTFASL